MATQGIDPTRASLATPAGAVVSAPAGASVPRERGILFSATMVKAILAGTKSQTRRLMKPQPSGSAPGVYGDRYNHSAQWAFWLPDNRMTEPRTWACPYGDPGDRLWCRETHAQFSVGEGLDRAVPQAVAYRATCDDDGGFDYANGRGETMRLKVTKWTPAIHMPRWASRITLEVTGVRVERVQDISEEDAIAEGVEASYYRETWLIVTEDGSTGDMFVEPDAETRASMRIELVKHRPAGLMSSARDNYRLLWGQINGYDGAGSWDANPFVWCVAFRVVDSAGGAT